MKQILIIGLMMVILSLAVSATSTVQIRYELDPEGTTETTIVKDVPFYVHMMMSANFAPTATAASNNVRDVRLHTAGTGFTSGDLEFMSATRGQWLPDAGNPDQNRLLSGNVWQYLFTAGHGTVDTTKDEFKSVLRFRLNTKSSGTLALFEDMQRTSEVGGNNEIFTISSSLPLVVDAQDSICGDGVVGYVDRGIVGVKDGDDQNEACDEGRNADGSNKNAIAGGCSTQCTYIELGWDCTNKEFGNRGSVCTRIPHREFLIQKLTALINGQCYPSCTHPAALYRGQNAAGNPTTTPHLTYDAQSKLDPSEKIYLLAQMGTALREFFIQTVVSTS